MSMKTYQSNVGRKISIEQNKDGGFVVTDDHGRRISYLASSAANIYRDWQLHGVDLSDANVPHDPESEAAPAPTTDSQPLPEPCEEDAPRKPGDFDNPCGLPAESPVGRWPP